MEEEGRGAPRRVQVNKFTGGRRVYVRHGRFGEDDDDDDDDELIVGIRQEGNSRLAGQLRLCSPQSQYLKYRKLILRRCGGLVVLGSNLSPEPPQSPQCGVKGRQIAL